MNFQEILEEFFALGNIARETKRILADGLQRRDTLLPSSERDYLSTTLAHLGHAREGFVLTLRAAIVIDWEEMRSLLDRVMWDWSWLEELGWVEAKGEEIQLPGPQLLAFAHAYVTLGLLPRLPPTEVTYPQDRPTYADIPVPRTPGQVMERLEELEQVVSEVELWPVEDLEPDPLRRTYGFFETGAWLIDDHLRRFAVL